MFRLLKYFKKSDWLFFALLTAILCGQVYFAISIPDRISKVIKLAEDMRNPDPTQHPSNAKIILECSLLVTYVFALLCITIATSYLSNKLSSKYAYYIRHEIFVRVNKISLERINKLTISSIIWRSTSEVEYLRWLMNQLFTLAITAPGIAFGGILKMWLTSPTGNPDGLLTHAPWQIIVLTFSIIVFMTVIVSVFAVYIIPKIKSMQKKNDKLVSLTREDIAGIKTIKSFGSYKYHGEKFNGISDDIRGLNVRINSINNLSTPAVNMLLSCLTIGIYWIGAALMNTSRQISYAQLIGYASLAGVIVNGFLAFIAFIVLYPQAQISANRILEVINCPIDIKDGDDKKLIEGQYGKIEFENVNYRSSGSKENILSNINFKADTGETIAIVGPTGSGKTTLLNLIMRFIEPNKGTISVDGNDIKKLKLTTLRKKIGYVPQRANLLNRTISDNIGLTFEKIEKLEELKIKKAASIAQAEPFIDSLAEKYSTSINEDATNLSGGQKQRISIARAIVDNPEFLLFDDSFSALDYITDAKLRNELNTKYKKTTKIIITNRISTLLTADRVYVLDKGRIIAYGKHKELIKQCTLYKEMINTQESLKGVIND